MRTRQSRGIATRPPRGSTRIRNLFAGLPISAAAVVGASYLAFAEVPPVPVPPENPITETKRILGKILFFDEQLSSTNTVACATCHVTARGGTDPRIAVNAGPDNLFGTPDDRHASPGVVSANASAQLQRDPVYGLNPQVTSRAANSPVNAAYAIDLFWDGRARNQFVDPETGQVAIQNRASLESQCVNPPISPVEMSHAGIAWTDIAAKLARVKPLNQATAIPPDVAQALADRPTYAELFRRAFGDTQISARRIAMAVATYERTLISDQTPWDRTRAGLPGGLPPGQQQGLNTFIPNCAVCHSANNGLFTDQTFRNIGLRPPAEDLGRQIVTGDPADRGRFKVPGLKNVGLQQTFMHNGQFTTLTEVVRFYVRAPGAAPQFPDNRDPAMNAIQFPPQAEPALVDFLANGLTDPRVRDQTFPFDRATLYTERAADQPVNLAGGLPGSGNVTPRVITVGPPMLGNQDFAVAVDAALGNSTARLLLSTLPPVAGRITAELTVGSVVTSGAGPGQGLATLAWPLNAPQVAPGQAYYLQWSVDDAAVPQGHALSNVVRIQVFCGSYGCAAACYANCDASSIPPVLNVLDFACFLNRFATADPYANCDGSATPPTLSVLDFNCFLNRFAQGCP
jgi:cytochrome c peroxidase